MFTCVALYQGSRFSDLELVALSSDQQIVSEAAHTLLAQQDGTVDRTVRVRTKAKPGRSIGAGRETLQ